MKVGFAGRWDPRDKRSWSGTYYYTYQEIKKHYDVEIYLFKWPFYVRERLLLHKQMQKLAGKKAAVEYLTGFAKFFSHQLEKELLKRKVDILYVPAAPQLIAFCKTEIPIIYMTDATFFQLQGYYHSYRDVATYNIRQGVSLDKQAFMQATHNMTASEWTQQSAIQDYGISESKITVAPLGPNLDRIPAIDEIRKEKSRICRLLFLGVEWERKGGDIALATFRALRKSNFPVELIIVGCTPPVTVNDPGISVIPFINKNIPEEAEKMFALIRDSHFLFLPTRAECAGLVYCEASAFGIPSITTNTGGVTTYVVDGINGYALPLDAGPEEYAEKISSLYTDTPAYYELCRNSRVQYEKLLNWEAWGRSFREIAERIHQ